MNRRHFNNLILAAIGTAAIAPKIVHGQDAAGCQYKTVLDESTGLCVRGFYDPARAVVPVLETIPSGVEITDWAGTRRVAGEAEIRIFATNYFALGPLHLRASLKAYNPNKGASPKFTDNNAVVLAKMNADGTTGQAYLEAIDTTEGVHSPGGEKLAEYGEDSWSEPIDVWLDLAEPTALAILFRPAMTDACPESSITIRLEVVSGTVLRSMPMLGDNQVWLTRQVDENHLLADVRRAQARRIILPFTGEYMLATDARVGQYLRVYNQGQAWKLLRNALLAELQCVARGLDPFTTTIGQGRALDSQLFRSAPGSEVVFHGGCTVGGLARNLSRAYLSLHADGNNWQDLNGLEPFFGQLYSW